MSETSHDKQELSLDELVTLAAANVTAVLEGINHDTDDLGNSIAQAITDGRNEARSLAAVTEPHERTDTALHEVLPALRVFAKYAAIVEADKGEQ